LILHGRVVLVTGASYGIGADVARLCGARGATVVLIARSTDQLQRVAAEVDGIAIGVDLSDPRAVDGLIASVERDVGPIDVLVNNAATSDARWYGDHTADQLRALMQLNLLSPAELCRQVLPGMARRNRGHIVNVSSLAATAVYPGLALYAASKGGLSQLTAGLRADLRGLDVGVTLAELGPVITQALERVKAYEPTAASYRRAYRLHLLTDAAPAKAAAAIVRAVEHNRRYVRMPRRISILPALAEAPRRIVELFLTGIAHRTRVPDEQ
jgi:short-subunit dehydrogenase